MKKLILTISLLSAIPVVNSCQDAYDIIQAGEFSNEATFKTTADLQLYLNEVYDKIDTTGEIEIGGILTDEVALGSQNGGQNTALYRFVFNPTSGGNNNGVDDVWSSHYVAINYANRLLKGAESVTAVDAADAVKKNSIIAQAKAIRAFCYFSLLTYFSPDLKNDSGLGVMLFTNVPASPSVQLPRSTVGEVFAQINADLNDAELGIGAGTGTLAKYKYVSVNMINALRARMYAYRGNYTQAELYADKVIATSGLTLTPATPVPAGTIGTPAWHNALAATTSPSPYRKMFADDATSPGEVIWALDRSLTKITIGSIYYFNQTNLGGGPYMDMGRNLFNILDTSYNNDIRRWAFIDPTSKIDPTYQTNPNYRLDDVLCIDKYPGKGAGALLLNDTKVFRLSEMYLIKAEARIAASDFVGAATRIKAIRDARSLTGATALPTYATATAAWKDLLKERRVELSFEGHRYIDIKRLGTLAGEQIDRNTRDTENMNEKTMAPNDHRFTFPIPFAEMNGNGNIQQNPGY